MIKIALVGCPGSGKSTCAADIFVQCKKNGITAELVQEYARILINSGWEISNVAEQFIVNINQRRKEDIIPEEIEVMITDSPAFLSYYYACRNIKSRSDNFALVEMYKQFLADLSRYDYIFFLNRVKDYVVDGTRIQTEEESDEIALQLKALLDMHHVIYHELDGNDSAVQSIMLCIDIDRNPGKRISMDTIKDIAHPINTKVPSKQYINTVGGNISNIETMTLGSYEH